MSGMKKNTTPKKTVYRHPKEESNRVEEPVPVYKSVKIIPPVTKDFTYSEFKKIADKTPFTQAEWAAILHVSERTLQRYAKSNGVFASINAERAMQIANVLKEGKITFGSIDNFYKWLKEEPYMLEGNLSFQSLTSADGINRILIQLSRIQHGLFA